MNNEMKDALNNDYRSNNFYDDSSEVAGLLNNFEVKELRSTFEELVIDDFKRLNDDVVFEDINYQGWTKFFGPFVKLHLVIQMKYYTFCVINENALESTIKHLEDSKFKTNLNYEGIRLNSYGNEYPFLTLSFDLPD